MNHSTWKLGLAALAMTLFVLAGHADELRNLERGQEAPAFNLSTLSGEQISSESLRGKATILIFVAAEQSSSEKAARAAHELKQKLNREDVEFITVTADASRAVYFRRFRDGANIHSPLLFDFERKLYGDLGLIVLPTTVILDKDWRLAHVISSVRSDYGHMLEAYVLHTLGEIDDDELAKQLETEVYERNRDEDRIARHRAAARLLRQRGLSEDAAGELQSALEIDPTNEDARLDLASVRIDQGKYDLAKQLVDQVLLQNENARRGKLLQGIILYHQGQLDEAEALLTRVLMLNPDPIYNHYYLGLIAEKKNQPKKAAEHYREALDRALRERPL